MGLPEEGSAAAGGGRGRGPGGCGAGPCRGAAPWPARGDGAWRRGGCRCRAPCVRVCAGAVAAVAAALGHVCV